MISGDVRPKGTVNETFQREGAGDSGPNNPFINPELLSAMVQRDVGLAMADSMHGVMADVRNVVRDMFRDLKTEITQKSMSDPVLQTIDDYETSHPGPTLNSGLRTQGSCRRNERFSRGRPSSRHNYSSCRDSSSPDTLRRDSSRERNHSVRSRHVRLPSFTGTEEWEVWHNRFSDVARGRGWTMREKLAELLPLMWGAAGEFVFGQLTQETRSDYQTLVSELNTRFRVIRSTKTYGVQFSHRNLKAGETAEKFAAEIKRLYDKAYPNRDNNTRKEDLLRRFLDGLLDEKTRFHVEYTKDPDDIDQAVEEVVNYLETSNRARNSEKEKKNKYSARAINEITDPNNNNDDDDHVARTATRADAKGKQDTSEACLKELKEVRKDITSFSERLTKIEKEVYQKKPTTQKKYSLPQNKTNNPTSNQTIGCCLKCGQAGHFIRDCKVTGQIQITPTNTNKADQNVTPLNQ